jgi:lipopolysaccharide export system protein LptC
VSEASAPLENPPDLVLETVAFVRLSEGHVSSRGTAEGLTYRRSAGRLVASQATVRLPPRTGSELAALGMLHLSAPRVEADTAARAATGSQGVSFDSERGDRARTDRVLYDGAAERVTSDTPLFAQGPGYRVRSRGFVARSDGSDVTLGGGVTGRLTQAAPLPVAKERRHGR